MAIDDGTSLIGNGWWGDGGFFGPALSVGADQSYVTQRTEDSAPANAVDAMQTVATPTQDDGFGWLKDLAKTAVGYAISKDAQQNRVVPPQVYSATAAQAQGQQAARAQSQQGGGVLVLIVVVGALVYALKD